MDWLSPRVTLELIEDPRAARAGRERNNVGLRNQKMTNMLGHTSRLILPKNNTHVFEGLIYHLQGIVAIMSQFEFDHIENCQPLSQFQF